MTSRIEPRPTGHAFELVLAGVLGIAAIGLYQVERELGYVALGLTASAFLLPEYLPEHRRLWLPVLATAGPLVLSLAIAFAVAGDPANRPTSALAVLWLSAALAYPVLIARSDTERTPAPAVRGAGVVGPAAAITLVMVAAVLRALWLDVTPQPFTGDEAILGIQGLELAGGATSNLFASGYHGSSTMYFQLLAWSTALPFDPRISMRLVSSGFGIAAVAFAYLLYREAFGQPVALAGAAFLALFHGHIHFSRQALPNIDDSLVTAATLFFCLRALRRRDLASFAIAGLVFGLTPYAWTTARVLPAGVVVLFTAALMQDSRRRELLAGAGVFAAGAVIVAAPLLAWWYEHPAEFRTREEQVFIFSDPVGPRISWYEGERDRGETPLEIGRGQLDRGLRAAFTGPENFPHLNSEIGFFGALPTVLAVLGLALAARHGARPGNAAILTLFVASFVGGALLAVPPASSARLIGMAVPGAAFVGLGATRLAAVPKRIDRETRLWLGMAVAVCVSLPGLYYYFGEWRTEGRFSTEQTRVAAAWGAALEPHLEPDDRLLWFRGQSPIPDNPTLRFELREQRLLLIGADGKVARTQAAIGSDGSPAAMAAEVVVATGAETERWVADFPACAGERPVMASSAGPQPERRIEMFRPGEACAAELKGRYPP